MRDGETGTEMISMYYACNVTVNEWILCMQVVRFFFKVSFLKRHIFVQGWSNDFYKNFTVTGLNFRNASTHLIQKYFKLKYDDALKRTFIIQIGFKNALNLVQCLTLSWSSC